MASSKSAATAGADTISSGRVAGVGTRTAQARAASRAGRLVPGDGRRRRSHQPVPSRTHSGRSSDEPALRAPAGLRPGGVGGTRTRTATARVRRQGGSGGVGGRRRRVPAAGPEGELAGGAEPRRLAAGDAVRGPLGVAGAAGGQPRRRGRGSPSRTGSAGRLSTTSSVGCARSERGGLACSAGPTSGGQVQCVFR